MSWSCFSFKKDDDLFQQPPSYDTHLVEDKIELNVKKLEEKQDVLKQELSKSFTALCMEHTKLLERVEKIEKKAIACFEIDRWTNPVNCVCSIRGGSEPITHLDCDCFGCLLIRKQYPTFDPTNHSTHIHLRPSGNGICPLDSDCTCLNRDHRQNYFHTIELGIIKGRDLELSKTQIELMQEYRIAGMEYAKHQKKYYIVVMTNRCEGWTPVQNSTRKDGIDIFQYKGIGGIIYDATIDDLFTYDKKTRQYTKFI